MDNHGPAISNYCRPLAQCRHFRLPARRNAGKHRDYRLVRLCSDLWATIGRQFSAIAIQVRNADISEFQQLEMAANTAIADFSDFSDSGQPWAGNFQLLPSRCAMPTFPIPSTWKCRQTPLLPIVPIVPSSRQPWAGNFKLLPYRFAMQTFPAPGWQ